MKKTCFERGHRYPSFWPLCPYCFIRKFRWIFILLIVICVFILGNALVKPYIYCTEPYLGCKTFTPTVTLTPTYTSTPVPPSSTPSPTPTSTQTPMATPTPKELNWIIDSPENNKGAVSFPSLAFGGNNQAVIAYLHDEIEGDSDQLGIVGKVGRSWDSYKTVVMNGSRPGFFPAIVSDSEGNFHVVHYFYNENAIAYMRGEGSNSKWNDVSVVAKNVAIKDMARGLTLAIGTNNDLFLAFLDTEDRTVNLSSLSYRTWNTRGVGRGDVSTGSVALAVDNTNQHLAFYNGAGLQYLRVKNSTVEAEQMIDSGKLIGLSPSMVIDKNGNLAIAYYAGDEIRLAIKKNGQWETYRIDDAAPLQSDSRRTTSIAFGPDGKIHLCYFDAKEKNGRLMYAQTDLSGRIVIRQEVDYGGVGLMNSLAIDQQGMPAIAYFDQTGENLRFAYVDSRR